MNRLKWSVLLLATLGLVGCKVGDNQPKQEPVQQSQEQKQTNENINIDDKDGFGITAWGYIELYAKVAKLYNESTGLMPNPVLTMAKFNQKDNEFLAYNKYGASVLGSFHRNERIYSLWLYPPSIRSAGGDVQSQAKAHFIVGLSTASLGKNRQVIYWQDANNIVMYLLVTAIQKRDAVSVKYCGFNIEYIPSMSALRITESDPSDNTPEYSPEVAKKVITKAFAEYKQETRPSQQPENIAEHEGEAPYRSTYESTYRKLKEEADHANGRYAAALQSVPQPLRNDLRQSISHLPRLVDRKCKTEASKYDQGYPRKNAYLRCSIGHENQLSDGIERFVYAYQTDKNANFRDYVNERKIMNY